MDGHSYEYQLGKRLTALREGAPFVVDCTCYGNQLVIQADCQVTNCPFLRIDQGHVRELPDAFRIAQTEVVRQWRNRLPLFSDSILTHFYGNILDGGGCAWSSLELYGDTSAHDLHSVAFKLNGQFPAGGG